MNDRLDPKRSAAPGTDEAQPVPDTRAPFRVAVWQYRARDETPAERIERLESVLAELGAGTTDLVCCPELFLSGYNIGALVRERAEPADGPSARAIAELAKRFGTAILYGYPELDGGSRYNAVACIGPDGTRIANHRKLQLPSDYERETFGRGGRLTFFELAGYRLGLLVCYDVEFPEAVRACALGGAEIVVAPTALRSKWAFVARQMIPTRAFENGVFLVYANYAGEEGDWQYLGESCAIGPDGSEIARAGSGEEVLRAELDPRLIGSARATLPYLSDRDAIPGR
ncbi:MAG: carbon-nitrogen hydrolase family protein [Dongiaceae bacterium]